MSISLNDILKIEDAIETAREDDTPYAVYGKEDNDVIEVIGDPNKTEVKSTDFLIKFRYTVKELNGIIPDGARVIGNHYVVFSHKFEDIILNPAKDLIVVSAMMDILPFFAELESTFEERKEEIERIEKSYNAKIKIPETSEETIKVIIPREDKRAEVEKKVENVMQKFSNKVVKLYIDGGDKLQLGLYNLVATLLGIDDELGAHMQPASVISATTNIIATYPELLNEAETLFGLS